MQGTVLLKRKKSVRPRRNRRASRHAENVVASNSSRDGALYAAAAYAWWGVSVFYFDALDHVAPSEVLSHRLTWSFVLGLITLSSMGKGRQLLPLLRRPRALLLLAATAALIGTSWYTYIWAIGNDRILEASAGYFIYPLINVFLGYVVLKERLTRDRKLSLVLATAGVAILTAGSRGIPAIALILAFTFSLYGLLRKIGRIDPLSGIVIETGMLSPLAVAYIAYLKVTDRLAFMAGGRPTDLMLLAAGPISMIPLLLFLNAARRLRYSTLGLMMYIWPTVAFLIAVLVFREPLVLRRLLAFLFLWAALAVLARDMLRGARGTSAIDASPPAASFTFSGPIPVDASLEEIAAGDGPVRDAGNPL